MIELLSVYSGCSSAALGATLAILKRIMNLIQIIVPILLMISLTLNLIKLVSNPDDKKALPKIKNAALAAVIVFMIPVFVNVVMNMLGENFSVSACWSSVNNPTGTPTYIDPYGTKKSKFLSDPSEYEKGKKRETTNGTGNSSYTGEYIEGTAQQVGDVVWDSTNVTRISNLTSTQLIGILNAHGGKAKNFIPYAQALITAEQKYSVNVFFLIGIEALESGWITSNISRNCNNLGGVRETASHPSNGCGSNSGGGFGYFNSVPEFIDYHASMLHRSYLTPGGKYYEGTSPYDVVKHYCPGSSTWPVSVIKIGNSLFSHVRSVI